MALAEAERLEQLRARLIEIRFPFELTGAIHTLVERLGGRIEARTWEGGAGVTAGFPSERSEEARARLIEALRDRGSLRMREGEVLLSP